MALVGSWRVGRIFGKIIPDEVDPDEDEVVTVLMIHGFVVVS